MYRKIGNVEKIIDVFRDLGFNDEQILKLVANKKRYISRIDSIKDSFSNYHEEMVKRNYTEDEIYALATNYPSAMFYRFYRGILKKDYADFIDNYREEKNQISETKIDLQGVTKVLKSVGLSQKKLDDIYTFNSPLLWMSIEDLEANIAFHKSCGISLEQLKINVNNYPSTLELCENDFIEVLEQMKKFDLGKGDLGRLISTCARLRAKIHPQKLLDNLKWAEDKKLNLKKLGKNILKSNLFIVYSSDALEKNFEEIIKLGINEENLKQMISSTPSILTMDKNIFAYIMNLLLLFDMSEEDMLNVITEYSAIFTLSIDNILSKLRVARDYNLIWYIIKNPKNLIQSAELTEARAEYLSTYYYYNEEEFARYVFSAEENFIRMFNVDNDYVKNEKILQKK